MKNELMHIENKIYIIRGHRVMLDSDLAELYDVKTKELNKAVKRNLDRFPSDFMFVLTPSEHESLRCQIGTSNDGRGGRRYLPHTFTEQGVAMLSSVLKSRRAIQINILIMRAFTKLREMISTHKDLQKKIDEMEKKYDSQFKGVFAALRHLLEAPREKHSKVKGFISN
ncbi:MAG: DNA-binding protein [Elusimicrobia bacterium RIFCSPLOWO2_01_FULL_54_10]|nr:MAG: DNA-binding protein [Elusimicrobia bacterium RIFCSPLOWO2_01_FULL_54_10]